MALRRTPKTSRACGWLVVAASAAGALSGGCSLLLGIDVDGATVTGAGVDGTGANESKGAGEASTKPGMTSTGDAGARTDAAKHAETPNNVDGGSGELSVPMRSVSLATGDSHTCALTGLGAVRCWGSNEFGELGTDDVGAMSAEPVEVEGLGFGMVAIAAGTNFTCALSAAGSIKCWGINTSGQLGNNSAVSTHTPVAVLGLETGVVAISAGQAHACAVLKTGKVKCWGANAKGQLGDNGAKTVALAPVETVGLAAGALAISASRHTCAVTSESHLKCWGNNERGQLGTGTTATAFAPMNAGIGTPLRRVASGFQHTCALTSEGAVPIYCWGSNELGQLGNGGALDSPTPQGVPILGVSDVVSGAYHSCALTNDDNVRCWGNGASGQLGNAQNVASNLPVEVVGLAPNAKAIAAGAYHACAKMRDGIVKCWGSNKYGQLGNGTTTDSNVPTVVAVP